MTQQNAQSTSEQAISENDLIAQRHAKLKQIEDQAKQTGTSPWPNTFKREHYAQDLQDQFADKSKEEIEAAEHVYVSVAGRVMLNRGSFIVIQDMTGRIQLYVARKELAPETLETIKSLDLGDIIAVKGYIGRSGKGDLYVHIEHFELLTKSLRPLPDKFHGLNDTEVKYRKRYLDLIVNEETRKTFEIRAKVVSGIRAFLTEQRFMEVETPMMHVIPGGASARPFETHHNALDMPLFLRIAPELYLKRLVVGGFERVFEINRNFRNEGISVRHNPEFTMMELYMAYADYKDLIELTESLFRTLAQDILGKTEVTYGDVTLDFGKPFEKLTMREAIKKYRPETDMADLDNFDSAKAIAESIGIHVEKSWGLGRIVTEIFEEVAEAHLIQPTFITEYPAEVSPLARRNDVNPEITDRFEFFIGGREIGNGFSELNDAEDQAQRFLDQVAAKDAGDDEAMFYDEDYVTALEHGLPPTAGLGIGIDRMVMLFTNSHTIRDVILFPAMRPVK